MQSAIDQFLGDPRVTLMRDRWRETRPLQICYPGEVPMTRMLEWLMDPTEGHALGDGAIRALLLEAWREVGKGLEVPQRIRKLLSPSHLEAQTFEDCLIQREVAMGDGRLDLLILEPRRKWLVAVENKFGAGESENQLKKYRLALERLYPDWDHVLVFLDYYRQAPKDTAWLSMNYDWLTTTLRTAEASMWLSEGSRQVLSAFRIGLEWETDPFENVCDENTVIAVVNDHREVFEQMKKWDDSPQPEHVRLAQIYRPSESLDVKATQQLYKVYWQKWYLWAECLPMLAYAGLLRAAREVFSDVQPDMHRKGVHFSRPGWEKVGAPAVPGAANYWPMVVCVYPEPRHRAGDERLFRVVTYLVPNRWHPALQVDPVVRLIDRFRKRSMRPTTWDFTSAGHTLAISRDIAEYDVAAKLTTHMTAVDALFREIEGHGLVANAATL